MTLYDYVKELDEIIMNATDEDGVISEDLTERLDELEMEISEKVDNCIKYYKSRKAMAEALKNEKMAITKRQQVAENEAERMKDYLAYCLNGEKFESVSGKISYRKSKVVEIDDLNLLPEEMLKVVISADKVAIKKAIEEGVELQKARILDCVDWCGDMRSGSPVFYDSF